jgi:hypothetical protein
VQKRGEGKINTGTAERRILFLGDLVEIFGDFI